MRAIIFLLTILTLTSCQSPTMLPAEITTIAFRLKPGEDLKEGIEKIAKEKQLTAGWITTAVGSLTDYSIRFANQEESAVGSGHFEIVSLTGTVSINGSHLHLSISDSTGKTIGGHLTTGCKIYTTAEIVIQASDKLAFTRENDGSTPWKELQIKEKKQN